ncbi:MAG: arginase family protein [Bacteroidia bacterium]
MLEQYFTKIKLEDNYTSAQIGAVILKNSETFPDLDKVQVALLGFENSEGTQSSNAIRESFYQLTNPLLNQYKVADLGNLREGKSEEDTRAALTDICTSLLQRGVLVLYLGGNVEQGDTLYNAFQNVKQSIEATLIAHNFPVKDYQLLNRMCTSSPNYLKNLNAIGFQAHFLTPKSLETFENMRFGHMRLGLVKTQLEDTELYVRDSALVLFDINAIKHYDAPGKKTIQPNGLSSEETCQITRYAGMSEAAQAFGIFGYEPELDHRGVTAALLAQMLWYYLDGYAHRAGDVPGKHDQFVKYRCDFSDDQVPILFLKSKKTSRWWMQIEHPAEPDDSEKELSLPCSYFDYQMAANGETPQRYLDALKRLS